MYGIRYLRVFDYVSVSQCATGPARESELYPERLQMEKKTNAPITFSIKKTLLSDLVWHLVRKSKPRHLSASQGCTRGAKKTGWD